MGAVWIVVKWLHCGHQTSTVKPLDFHDVVEYASGMFCQSGKASLVMATKWQRGSSHRGSMCVGVDSTGVLQMWCVFNQRKTRPAQETRNPRWTFTWRQGGLSQYLCFLLLGGIKNYSSSNIDAHPAWLIWLLAHGGVRRCGRNIITGGSHHEDTPVYGPDCIFQSDGLAHLSPVGHWSNTFSIGILECMSNGWISTGLGMMCWNKHS